MHTAWELYCTFWRNNGNVALIWHMSMGVLFIGCIVMVFCGDRLDQEHDARHEYLENTDHHDY